MRAMFELLIFSSLTPASRIQTLPNVFGPYQINPVNIGMSALMKMYCQCDSIVGRV